MILNVEAVLKFTHFLNYVLLRHTGTSENGREASLQWTKTALFPQIPLWKEELSMAKDTSIPSHIRKSRFLMQAQFPIQVPAKALWEDSDGSST